MRRVIFSSTGLRAIEIFGPPADEREQFAVSDLRNGAEHRRFNQARPLRLDQRRELAPGHRLQGAHFDEQLAIDITAQEAFRTL